MTADPAVDPPPSPPASGASSDSCGNWPEAPDPQLGPERPGPRIAADDMDDPPGELERFFPGEPTSELGALLAEIRQPIADHAGKPWPLYEFYRLWDGEAVTKQRDHVRLVRDSGIFAMLAVILALVQLLQVQWEKFGIPSWIFEVAEVGCAIAAFAAVVFGIRSAWSHLWQLRRLQAEQCRLLKFGFLLRAASSLDDARQFLVKGIGRLKELGSGELPAHKISKMWVRGELDLLQIHPLRPVRMTDEGAWQLADYYVRKRLRYQAAYFKKQAHRREFREKLLSWVPETLFFASLIVVIIHGVVLGALWFAAWWLQTAEIQHHEFDLTCLFFAVALPTLAAWVRTYLGALEFARNANRFESMCVQLHDFEAELVRRRGQGDLAGLFEVLRDVEIALESEHRSWTRLMVEAEWFG